MADKLDCEVLHCTWASPDTASLQQGIKLLEVHNRVKHAELLGGQLARGMPRHLVPTPGQVLVQHVSRLQQAPNWVPQPA